MDYEIRQLTPSEFPPLLREIPDPPKTLYQRGTPPPENNMLLAIVGSRKYSTYGKQVVGKIVQELRGFPISIVSGLALGIDALAHSAALAAGLHTIAIPGSGIHESVLYPRSHRALALQILKEGGMLLSEFDPYFEATPWSFPKRNRIMAGISSAVLVIEATQKSGTLITSRLATEYNRDVLTVPGSIFSKSSAGPHMLIGLGATPVTSGNDVLDALNIEREQIADTKKALNISKEEDDILALLSEPRGRDELIRRSRLGTQKANMLLSMMELEGYIKEEAGTIISLV